MTERVNPDRDVHLQGHYAGIVSRLAAFAIDAVTVVGLFALAGLALEFVVSAVVGDNFALSEWPTLSRLALLAWAFFYCAYSLTASGKTLGMVVIGLQVVGKDGSDLNGRHAMLRVLVFPLSFILFGFGFVLILLKRDRRALHDLIATTAVVYSWDARAARLRFLARRPTPAPGPDPGS